MLARLRSTTVALLGAVTAVGLGLVAFIAQLGFPGAFNGAIPDGPSGSGVVHDAIALTQGAGNGRPVLSFHQARTGIRSSSPGTAGSIAGPGLGSSNQLGHGPGKQPPSANTRLPSAPASEPTGEFATASPAPSPAPTTGASRSPKPDSAAQPTKPSSAMSKSKGHSRGKAKSHAGAKPDASTTGGSKSSPKAGKAKGHSGGPSKSAGSSPGKSGESPDSQPSGVPPSTDPAEKKPPEVDGRESRNGGKSDQSHH